MRIVVICAGSGTTIIVIHNIVVPALSGVRQSLCQPIVVSANRCVSQSLCQPIVVSANRCVSQSLCQPIVVSANRCVRKIVRVIARVTNLSNTTILVPGLLLVISIHILNRFEHALIGLLLDHMIYLDGPYTPSIVHPYVPKIPLCRKKCPVL
jgi:hypothetical protein